MRNKKENFSNQNNNQIYKKLEKGEQTNKNTLARKKLESLNSPINNFFLYIFLVLAICLTTTLYLFYRFNSNNTDELYYLSDVHRLKAYIKPAQFIEDKDKKLNNLELNSQVKLNVNSDIYGFIEINEVFDGISIIGKLSGFTAGSTHAVHIIEFSDIIATIEDSEKSNPNSKSAIPSNYIKKRVYPVKDLAEVKLKHYNPLKYKHSCPSTNDEENYHFGDLGNIIANSEGKAFISIMRKVSLKSLNGRLIVISNSPDKCKEGTEADRLADVIAYGQLNVFKPAVAEKTNGSQEYFLREINVVNKEEFEKNNSLIKDDLKKDVKKDATNERKENNIKNVNEDKKKDLKNNDLIGTRDSSNFKGKEGIGAPESRPLISMRKDFEPANDNSLHSKDQNSNYFTNTVFNNDSEIFRNNNNKVFNEAKPDKNINKNIVSDRFGPNENKDLEIPMFNLNSNNKNNSNDLYRNDISVNPKKLKSEEDSTKVKNNYKNSEDNDSFIKEFRDLMKEANSQPKQIKSSDDMLFNPFSDSNAKLNNAKPAPAVREFNPFETLNPIITKESEANKDKKANEFNKKNPHDLNKPAVNAYGSEIIFPKVDILNPPSKDKDSFKPENKNKKELSDEDILNDLLGISDDFNKTIKKDPSSAKMKKAPSAAFIVPGSEGVIIENLDSNNANKNFNSNLKDSNKNAIRDNSNFFNVLEKETNDLKNSNNNNLNIFGAPSGKKSDIGINKLFEDIVKEEEKAQQKKIENLNTKEPNSNNKNLDLDLDSNLNQTSEKLDREIKKIPISLAQMETEKEENAKKMKKKKIEYNRSQKSKDYYSPLMTSNLEPLMNNLVTNSTAKRFINNVDLNLIDPYKISDMDDDNKNNNAKAPKEKSENSSRQKKETKRSNQELEEKKSIFSELSKEEEEAEAENILEELSDDIKITPYNTKAEPNAKTLNKITKTNVSLNANKNKALLNNPEDIYKIKIDNIENFQDIIKNKTLNDLERLPDKPIDLPLANKKNNLEKSTSKNETTKAGEKPIAHKSNNFLKEKNSLFFDMNKKENFRFLNKLSENNHFDWLKFRQHNLEKELIDNSTDLNVVAVLNKNSTKTASDSKENTELQQALENKIKNYYTQNKNYLQKLNGNLTSLDKKILGIAKFEKDSAVMEKNNSAAAAVKVKDFDENKIKDLSDLNKDKNLITSFIQNVKANMGSNLKEIADKFLKEKPEKPIDFKGLSNSVLSSIQNKVSKSEAENNTASDKKEKENKNEEEINKSTNIMIENGKIKVFQDSNINKKMKRPEKDMKYSTPSYFNPGLDDLDEDENEEEEGEEKKQKTQNISDDNENEFDNFFFIPKGSIIDTTHKSLFNIGNEISKDTKSLEDEIAEDIKLDLFDEPNLNTDADGKLNNNNKNKGKKFNKSGFKSMDKFLEKFGNDKIYADKIHKVDKNKMFLNHFKNTLPKFQDN